MAADTKGFGFLDDIYSFLIPPSRPRASCMGWGKQERSASVQYASYLSGPTFDLSRRWEGNADAVARAIDLAAARERHQEGCIGF